MTTLISTDSKTAREPYQNSPRVEKDAEEVWHIRGYTESKDLLKQDLLQDGFGAENIFKSNLEPVLYQYGEPHRKQRSAIAKYFSPTTVSQKHWPMMERAADEILADLIQAKQYNLKTLTTRLAAVVTAAVVGLNPTKSMIRRIDAMLHSPPAPSTNPILRFFAEITGYSGQFQFWFFDVRPAINERKRNPQDDVVSYMLSKGKSGLDILVECIVYGAAGMATRLREQREHALLWRQLTTIALDAPLPEGGFARGRGDGEELASLSDWMGFGPLTRKRLADAAGLSS